MITTWSVHFLDVWGNAEEGYDVNDVYPSQGLLEVGENEELIACLVKQDYIVAGFDESKMDIDYHENYIYIAYDGKPEMELRRVETAGV